MLITPSYRGDSARCELLCESIDRCLPADMRHLIVVDRRDLPRMRALRSRRRELLTVEDVLGIRSRKLPGNHRSWIVGFRPTHGWIIQQLVKLRIARHAPGDWLLFVDSDVAFVRRWDPASLWRGGRLALYRVDGMSRHDPGWHRSAARFLGLQPRDDVDWTYVGNLIAWHTRNARALESYLRGVHGRRWLQRLAATDLSEYTLYGWFVENLLPDRGGHYLDAQRRCHDLWHRPTAAVPGLAGFLETLSPEAPAIMVASTAGFAVTDYRAWIERQWAAGGDPYRSRSAAREASRRAR